MFNRLLEAGPLLLLVLAALAATIFLTLAATDALRQRGRSRSEALLTTLMRATGQRRDRGETFGTALALLRQELGARSGLIVQAGAAGAAFTLTAAEGIARLDAVLALPADDLILATAVGSAPVARLVQVPEHSRWNALSDGRADWLAAVAFGSAVDVSVLVLAWPERAAAQRSAAALAEIGPYLSQVVGDYANLERRAREIQSLNAALRDQELLVRTSAHDLGNALVEPNVFITGLEGRLPAELEPDRASAEHKLAMIGSMVADLVDPGRPLERERVAVEELVQLAVPLYAALRPGGPPLGLDVPADLPLLWIDRVAILRVLANLLTNAAVHNADQADLHVRLRLRRQDAQIGIEIADNGRGIALEDQERVFEFGVRVDPQGRARGYGLGLSSSRRLVAAHGGALTLHSEPGHGAVFTLTLPLEPAPPASR